MASTIQLKRSAQSGKVPDTGSLNLGELAINTYDGKIYFKKSGSVESVESVLTTNSTVTGSIRLEGTGSFGSLKVNDTLTINHGEAIISGSALVTSDLTILGAVNARQFNISVISSSVLFESGSSRFGNTSDDTHQFTGSVQVTGSLYVNGVAVATGSGAQGTYVFPNAFDFNVDDPTFGDFNSASLGYNLNFGDVETVGSPIHFVGGLSNLGDTTVIYPTSRSIDFVVDDIYVGSISSQSFYTNNSFTASLQQGYTWVGNSSGVSYAVATSSFGGALPSGVVSGSSQLTSSVLATTGSNTFRGTQTLSGSLIPAIDNTYDLGSATYQWRDIYVSSGSLYIDGTKVLGSTGNELQITTDVGQSIKILEAGSDSIILQSADGDIQLKTSGGGNLLFDPTTGLIDVRGTLQIQDGNKITSSGGLGIVFGNNIVVSGSIESTGTINGINLSTFSSSVASTLLNQNTATSSYETKGSGIISGSSQVDVMSTTNIARLATTGSNTFFGTQTFSGSVYIANDLVVQGSSSIQYISASSVSIGTNIVQLNTANPSVRYAGLTIIDSGSVGGSGSFLYDSVQDEFIFVHRGNGVNVTSSHFVLGPETYDDLGNETYLTNNRIPKGTGKEHLNDSNITDTGTLITLGSNTVVNGTFYATNTTLVSGSAQVVGILSSLNTYSASIDTKFTTLQSLTASNSASIGQINAVTASLNAATSSYETKGRGIVSGSSQVDVMSTTNIARLATTGSNTFTSNQTINGNISLGTTNYSYVGPSQYSGVVFPRGQILFSNTNTQNQLYISSNAYTTAGGVFAYRNTGQPAGFMAIDNGSFSIGLAGNGTADANITFSTPISISNAGVTTFGGNVIPDGNGTRDLGSAAARWSTIYTSDLSLNNGIGDWTIVEGEDDLFLYNNKKGKVYKFALTEVDPNVATPKKS